MGTISSLLAIISALLLANALFSKGGVYALLPAFTACAIPFIGFLLAFLFLKTLKGARTAGNKKSFALFLMWVNLLLSIALTIYWLYRIFFPHNV